MSESRVTLRQQLEAFKNGIILASDGTSNDQGFWNFYDWFCQDGLLKNKGKRLMKMVKQFVEFHNIDLDKHYVWFKNNCTTSCRLYDDFRISDIETGENIHVITPKSGHTGMAEYHGPINLYRSPLKSGAKFKDLLVK